MDVYINGFTMGSEKSLHHRNWGDELNYFFLQEIMEDVTLKTFRRGKDTPYYLFIGSILEDAYVWNDEAIVWGSGVPRNKAPRKKLKKIYAVRGPLTRETLINAGNDCPEVYGDPALLLPYYYNPQIEKKYKIGIIPHWTSRPERYISEKILNDPEVKIIKMGGYKKWTDVIDEILSCEYIVSESLHGLIVAEAYGIPNVWAYMNFSSQNIKYHDFFLSLDKEGRRDRKNAFKLTQNITKDEILNECEKYERINNLDLRPLVESCPFKLKIKLPKE